MATSSCQPWTPHSTPCPTHAVSHHHQTPNPSFVLSPWRHHCTMRCFRPSCWLTRSRRHQRVPAHPPFPRPSPLSSTPSCATALRLNTLLPCPLQPRPPLPPQLLALCLPPVLFPTRPTPAPPRSPLAPALVSAPPTLPPPRAPPPPRKKPNPEGPPPPGAASSGGLRATACPLARPAPSTRVCTTPTASHPPLRTPSRRLQSGRGCCSRCASTRRGCGRSTRA